MKLLNTFCAFFAFFLLASSLFAQESEADFSNIEAIIKNETSINSEALEYSPAFYENGIVFISSQVAGSKFKIKDSQTGQNIHSIFNARRNDEEAILNTPEPFAEDLLSSVHEGPLTFDRTNKQIFFTRVNLKNGRLVRAKDGIAKLKIYAAENMGGSNWGEPMDLPFNDQESNAGHPSVAVEQNLLYFASDRPGGNGGYDIYVVERIDGVWGEPENLGPQINTQGNEAFPFIHADGTLYFASDGHKGQGGFDLFFSYPEEDGWSNPVNFEILNSPKDDIGMIIDRDKKNGYFSSNRPGGLGEDDIYSFYIRGDLDEATDKRKEVAKEVKVLVRDQMTGEMLGQVVVKSMPLDEFTLAKAIITDEETGKEGLDENLLLRVPFDESSKTGYTNSDGEYETSLIPGNYIIRIEYPGKVTKRTIFNLSEAEESGEMVITMEDRKPEPEVANGESREEIVEAPEFVLSKFEGLPSKIEEGTVFQLPNIYYNFNDASIRQDARRDLDDLAQFLSRYEDIEIELSSHTDSRGSREYNRDLSQRRAQNAVNYLVEKNISRSRMTAVGYGESVLRNNCYDGVNCTEEEHQYNRRTEVKITKMDGSIDLRVEGSSASYASNDDRPKRATTNPSVDRPKNNSGSVPNRTTSRQYQVIAGAFKNYDYAQARLDDLISKGYSGAEIEFMESRKLYSVIVSTFDSRGDADNTVQDLKNSHSIKSFVKRK